MWCQWPVRVSGGSWLALRADPLPLGEATPDAFRNIGGVDGCQQAFEADGAMGAVVGNDGVFVGVGGFGWFSVKGGE